MSTFAPQSSMSRTAESSLLDGVFAANNRTFNHDRHEGADLEASSAAAGAHQFARDFSRIPVHAPERLSDADVLRQSGSGDTSSGGPASAPISGFFFCNPPFDSSQIRNALSTAQSWVGTVVPILDLFRMGRLTGDRETAVRVALRENFNITDPFPRFSLTPQTPLETLLANLTAIERALSQPLQFYCTHACLPGDLAWVLSNPDRFGLPPGIINICPGFFGCDPLKQASTIIHERAHEAIGAEDRAYEVSATYDSLSTTTALENADSYAVFVRQVYHNGIHRPGMACSILTSRMRDFELSEPTLRMPTPRRPRLLPPEE